MWLRSQWARADSGAYIAHHKHACGRPDWRECSYSPNIGAVGRRQHSQASMRVRPPVARRALCRCKQQQQLLQRRRGIVNSGGHARSSPLSAHKQACLLVWRPCYRSPVVARQLTSGFRRSGRTAELERGAGRPLPLARTVNCNNADTLQNARSLARCRKQVRCKLIESTPSCEPAAYWTRRQACKPARRERRLYYHQ